MQFLRRNAKRILTDGAGYLLILAALLLSPVPGPGGIPLAIAGLGLLSINNAWAARLRRLLLDNGGKVVQYLFPPIPWVQLAYDVLVLLLFGLVTVLAIRHDALWQISLAIVFFFGGLFIAATNRDRLKRLKHKLKK